MLAFQIVLREPVSTIATAGIKNGELSNKQIKDYVVIVIIILLQYLCCENFVLLSNIKQFKTRNCEPKINMGDRLNIGREVRELKLGSTFSPQNSQTAFHTIKYDFKPASVDLNRVATVDVGSNNQVTVTVPNIESSGVPHTVFKGNQRKYTKECLIIFDRKTGTVTLERLNHNIQVKKTRSEIPNKTPAIPPPGPQKMENNTQRTSSKTRVSTGSRKNNIIGFVPRNSPMQGSPSSYSSTHKSPQTSAPAICTSSRWNAGNAQATLPSIPMIELDDDMGMTGSHSGNHGGNLMTTNSGSNAAPEFQQQHHHPAQYQNNVNNMPHLNNNNSNLAQTSSSNASLAIAAAALEQEIGVLTSSDSSSDSDSSGSGSDSDDSIDEPPHQPPQNHQQQNQFQAYANGSFPTLLHDDLQLSESCSSEADDD